jgi:hypothetical protein
VYSGTQQRCRFDPAGERDKNQEQRFVAPFLLRDSGDVAETDTLSGGTGIRTIGYQYADAGSGLPGKVAKCSGTGPAGSNPCSSGGTTSRGAKTFAASDSVLFNYNYRPRSSRAEGAARGVIRAEESGRIDRSSPTSTRAANPNPAVAAAVCWIKWERSASQAGAPPPVYWGAVMLIDVTGL